MRAPRRVVLGAALVCCGLFAADPVRADQGCGAVKLQGGQVLLARPLPDDWSHTAAGRRCADDIGKELLRNRMLRSVTVSNRLEATPRTEGAGLAAARALADALVQSGLPRPRVFAVAPLAAQGEAPGLVVRYAERAPESVVARIGEINGSVALGQDEATLRPAESAMPLFADELVRTAEQGQAVLRLLDGSGIRLGRSTLVKLARLHIGDAGERAVRVEVLRGQIEAEVRKAATGSSFDASSRIAVASVRGTIFRFCAEASGSMRLETLEGSVQLSGLTAPSASTLAVPAGQGARALDNGTTQGPRPLPSVPRVLAPLRGVLPEPALLSFDPVPLASSYRIEVARDADFLLEVQEYTASAPPFLMPARPAAGKWFWRVTATSAEGFVGAPSKVYSFTVIPAREARGGGEAHRALLDEGARESAP